MTLKIKLHTDPGHGWAEVKRSELKALGIEDQISEYSYQKGGLVYLEEDGDLTTYINAKLAHKDPNDRLLKWETHYEDPTPIRGYQPFAPGLYKNDVFAIIKQIQDGIKFTDDFDQN